MVSCMNKQTVSLCDPHLVLYSLVCLCETLKKDWSRKATDANILQAICWWHTDRYVTKLSVEFMRCDSKVSCDCRNGILGSSLEKNISLIEEKLGQCNREWVSSSIMLSSYQTFLSSFGAKKGERQSKTARKMTRIKENRPLGQSCLSVRTDIWCCHQLS